jgi:hypothetical protein
MLTKMFVHMFQHSTYAEQWSLELEKLTKDPSQINVQLFINASVQIQKILNFALVDRKVKYLLTYFVLQHSLTAFTGLCGKSQKGT